MSTVPEAETSHHLQEEVRNWQYAIGIIIIMFSIAISVAIFIGLRNQEQERIVRDFYRASQDRITASKKTLDSDFMALKSIRAFYDGSDEVTRHEFHAFVSPLIENHLSIHAVAWLPRVRDIERSKYERIASEEESIDNFSVSELDKRGNWKNAAARSEYFPVFFVHPNSHNKAIPGADLASIPAFRKAMDMACDSGKCWLSSKISEPVRNNHTDVWAFLPVYEKNVSLYSVEARRQALQGFVLGILSPEWIIQSGLETFMPVGIDVELLDTTVSNHPQVLFDQRSRLDSTTSEDYYSESPPLPSLRRSEDFQVAGRQWSIVCTATPSFVASRTTWYPWVATVMVFLLGGFSGLYLIGVTKKSLKTTLLANRLTDTNRKLQNEIAEREAIESTLKDSEQRLRLFVENVNDLIWMLDFSGRFTYMSSALTRLTGLTWTEDSNITVADFMSGESLAKSEKTIKNFAEKALKGERPETVNLELILDHVDGSHTWVEANVNTRYDESMNPIGLMGIARNIEDRKRAEEELRETEKRLRLFLDNISDFILTMDFEGHFTYVSPSTVKHFGFSPEEYMKLSMEDALTPESYAIAKEKLQEMADCAQRGRFHAPFTLELEALRKDKSTIWVEITCGGMYDESGKMIAVQAVSRDITQRRQMEQELRNANKKLQGEIAERESIESTLKDSEQRLRLFVENVSDLIWMLDFSGRFTYMSPAFTKLTGLTWTEDSNITVADFMSGESRALSENTIREFAEKSLKGENPETVNLELILDHVDGSHTWIEANVNTRYDESMNPIGLMGVARDIEDRKKAEEELRKAKEDAEAATRAKSRFLATMSHEIRTPMTAILGYADLLMDPKISASSRNNYLATIRRSGEHLLSLINDILDLSKIEAGKMTLDSNRCSIVSLMADVASVARPRAESQGISFSIEYEGAIPETIITDSMRLRQAIINLAGNAVKFTEKGSVRVALSMSEKEETCDNQPAIHIQVIDTGIGINEEELPKIFQPFSQSDSSITQKFGGTGLGLTISRHIAHLLGGELTAESVPNEGSTFTLTVPTGSLEGVRLLTSPAEVELDSQQHTWQSSKELLRGVRILLAEDGYDNRELIKVVLYKAGATVDTAENGRIAVDKAKKEAYDLILMDMNMPEMDGYEATSVLRDWGYSKPILALTANAMVEDRQRCCLVGCDEYLTKPIDRVLLVQAIAKYVNADKTSDEQPPLETEEQTPLPESDNEAIFSEFADDADLKDTVVKFVGRLAGNRDAMQQALDSGEFSQLQDLAHKLKGAGGSHGYPSLSEACKTLEDAAKAANSSDAREAFDNVATTIQAIELGCPEAASA